MSDRDAIRTIVGVMLGITEVALLFGMLYAGIFGITKEIAKKLLGG